MKLKKNNPKYKRIKPNKKIKRVCKRKKRNKKSVLSNKAKIEKYPKIE